MLKVVVSVDLGNHRVDVIDAYLVGIDIDLENILSVVSYEVGISVRNIKSKSRIKEFVDARKLYYHLSRKYTNKSFARIGQLVGSDHSTVHFGCKKAEAFLENEIDFKNTYNSIKERLNLK